MAEPTGAGTKAIVDAIQQSSQGTINGVTAATKEVQKEVGDLTNKITSQLGDLSDTVEDNKPSEEDKKESKNTQNKQLGVLGAIAGSLLALPKVLATTTKTNVSCYGGNNANITANPSGGTAPYFYLWSDGQSTQTATGLSAGIYTCIIADANGCIKNN